MSATASKPGRETAEAIEWLRAGPPLAELKTRYPQDWETVSAELADIFATGKPEQLQTWLAGLAAPLPAQARGVGRRPGRQQLESAALARLIRHRMAHLALKGYVLSAAAGGKGGKIRFNWFNGFVAQRLLFAHDLVRKPVSMAWFRLFWPLLWQKNL
ncbi:MAG: hypothetical protein PHX10_11160, partial [Gallionellaceae bacterium]|nr:hypothetical protein [Gallionellaceae bacterium]